MIDGFLLKKLVSVFVHLIPGVPLLLLMSLLLRRWLPRFCTVVSLFLCFILVAGSFPTVSDYFVRKLEIQVEVLLAAPEDTGLILVLGYGHIIAEGKPVNTLLSPVALSRLTEAVRLWKTKPDVTLAVSGAAPVAGTPSHAEMMYQMALELGVPSDSIVRFDHARDTEDEIDAAVKWLDNNSPAESRIIVVSTAMHLPRASMIASQHNIGFLMAPTEFTVSNSGWKLPSVSSLLSLDRAIHEWVGMAWYRLREIIG